MASASERAPRKLTWLLRHNAAAQGLTIGSDGYVPCAEVLAFLQRSGFPAMTQADLHAIVSACPKQRFQLSPCGSKVRATQGHSIKGIADEELLSLVESADEVPVAVHGTYSKFLDSIMVCTVPGCV
jgi:RNA:NAD 2'-phosphotransferase (TPT1/KptA family)